MKNGTKPAAGDPGPSEMARAVEEFRHNPPPEVVERLRAAAEESHRLRCRTCRGQKA